MKKDDIEDLFKKSFENFEAEVNPSVWKNIQTALKGAGLGALVKAMINKLGTNTLIAVVSSVAAVVSTVAIINWTSSNSSEKKSTVALDKKAKPESKINVQPTPVNEIKEFLAAEGESKIEHVEPVKKEINTQENSNDLTPSKNSVKEKKVIEKNVFSSLINEAVAQIVVSEANGSIPLRVDFTNKGTGKFNTWTYTDGKNTNTMENGVHVFDTPGEYTVFLSSKNANGKTDIDTIKVKAIANSAMTNYKEFSPNGDGVVDVFPFNGKNLASMNIVVFDTKGETAYSCEGLNCVWDGKNLKGEKAKEGIYYYTIKVVDLKGKNIEQKGGIKLTR